MKSLRPVSCIARLATQMTAQYQALPVRLETGSEELRFVHLRQHRAERSDDVEPDQRTLFVAAVPACWGLSGLQELLSRFGAVESCAEVTLTSLPAPAAHVRFASPKALQRVLAAAREGAPPLEPPAEESCSVPGLAGWLAAERAERPGLQKLQARLDSWTAQREAEEEEAEREAAEAAAGDAGWTVVGSKRGRKKTVDAESKISVGGVSPALAKRKAAEKAPLPLQPGFYKFQRKDAARDAVLALREKFEQDRARIVELRRTRAFKPL